MGFIKASEQSNPQLMNEHAEAYPTITTYTPQATRLHTPGKATGNLKTTPYSWPENKSHRRPPTSVTTRSNLPTQHTYSLSKTSSPSYSACIQAIPVALGPSRTQTATFTRTPAKSCAHSPRIGLIPLPLRPLTTAYSASGLTKSRPEPHHEQHLQHPHHMERRRQTQPGRLAWRAMTPLTNDYPGATPQHQQPHTTAPRVKHLHLQARRSTRTPTNGSDTRPPHIRFQPHARIRQQHCTHRTSHIHTQGRTSSQNKCTHVCRPHRTNGPSHTSTYNWPPPTPTIPPRALTAYPSRPGENCSHYQHKYYTT